MRKVYNRHASPLLLFLFTCVRCEATTDKRTSRADVVVVAAGRPGAERQRHSVGHPASVLGCSDTEAGWQRAPTAGHWAEGNSGGSLLALRGKTGSLFIGMNICLCHDAKNNIVTLLANYY